MGSSVSTDVISMDVTLYSNLTDFTTKELMHLNQIQTDTVYRIEMLKKPSVGKTVITIGEDEVQQNLVDIREELTKRNKHFVYSDNNPIENTVIKDEVEEFIDG